MCSPGPGFGGGGGEHFAPEPDPRWKPGRSPGDMTCAGRDLSVQAFIVKEHRYAETRVVLHHFCIVLV